MPENFANFAKSSLGTGIISTDTSLSVATGEGARFPVAPFRATIWNATDYVDPADDPDREIVLVTAIAGDTFTTIERGEEGTTAGNHNTAGKTYAVVAALTANSMRNVQTVGGVTTVDINITNSASITPVPGMSVALQAGRVYHIHVHATITLDPSSGVNNFWLSAQQPSGDPLDTDMVQGFAWTFSVPLGSGPGSMVDSEHISSHSNSNLALLDPAPITAVACYVVDAEITMSVITSGSYEVAFSQDTATSDTITLKAGACITATPVG